MTPSASLLTSGSGGHRKMTHKLTAADIAELRRLRSNGERIVDLAVAYDVTRATIRHHVRGCVVSGELRKIKSAPRTRKPNNFTIDGAVCRIELEHEVYALIDTEFAEKAKMYIWSCHRGRNGVVNAVVSSTHVAVRLHDFVFGPHAGYCLDHKNRNPLDNRLNNLRVASRSQNGANMRPLVNKSGYRGVVYRPHLERWAATVKLHGVQRWFGTYETPELAAIARDEAAKQLHGDFAVLNFPEVHCAAP